MIDICTECNEEFSIKDLVPQYIPELDSGRGASVWFCNKCMDKINSIDGKPSYMVAPGVKNFHYAPDDLIRDVCYFFKISIEDMKKKSRERKVLTPRQVCTYAMKLKFGHILTLKEIGGYFGKNEHSTVHHSIAIVTNDMDTDKAYKKMVDDLLKVIDSHIINQNSVAEMKH